MYGHTKQKGYTFHYSEPENQRQKVSVYVSLVLGNTPKMWAEWSPFFVTFFGKISRTKS